MLDCFGINKIIKIRECRLPWFFCSSRDMEHTRKFAAIFALAAILLVSPVSGIKCVQCISESSRACIDSPPIPRQCDDTARYCIVVRESLQHNSSVVTVTRTCSPVDLGSKCHDSFSLAGESVLVCHEACDSDGCNGLRPEPVKTVKAVTAVKAVSDGSTPSQATFIIAAMLVMYRVIT